MRPNTGASSSDGTPVVIPHDELARIRGRREHLLVRNPNNKVQPQYDVQHESEVVEDRRHHCRTKQRFRKGCVRKCKPNAARMKLHQPQYFPQVPHPKSQCNQPQEADDERRTLDQKLVVFRIDGPRKSAVFILTYLATRNQYLVVQVRKALWRSSSRNFLPHPYETVDPEQQRWPQCREDVKFAGMQREIFRQGIGQTMKPSIAFVQPAEFSGYRQYSAESKVKTLHLVYSHGRKSEHRKGQHKEYLHKVSDEEIDAVNTKLHRG